MKCSVNFLVITVVSLLISNYLLLPVLIVLIISRVLYAARNFSVSVCNLHMLNTLRMLEDLPREGILPAQHLRLNRAPNYFVALQSKKMCCVTPEEPVKRNFYVICEYNFYMCKHVFLQ